MEKSGENENSQGSSSQGRDDEHALSSKTERGRSIRNATTIGTTAHRIRKRFSKGLSTSQINIPLDKIKVISARDNTLNTDNSSIPVFETANNPPVIFGNYYNLQNLDKRFLGSMLRSDNSLTTYISIPDANEQAELNDVLNINVQPAIHNKYNRNIGMFMIKLNDKLSVLSHFVMITNQIMLLPKHTFDVLTHIPESTQLLLAFTNEFFFVNIGIFLKSAGDQLDINVNFNSTQNVDLQLLKLPFIVSNIIHMKFSAEKGTVIKSKHIVKNQDTYRLQVFDHPLSLLVQVPGKTLLNIHDTDYVYDYTHTFTPSSYIGMSGSLIFTAQGEPWGLITAKNGSTSCEFLNKWF